MELSELADLLRVPDLPATVRSVEAMMEDLLAGADLSLSDPCLRILRGRGKRVRPALVIAAAAACGTRPASRRRVLAGAAAMELLHIGSLVHDDILDHAEDRRGVPSISFLEGPDTAVLCGDVLFALSGHAAALVGQAAAVESANTIVAICNGQIRELVDNFNPARSERAILDTIEGKTAMLLRTSCRVGGLCAGLEPQVIDALGNYGHAFGMCFQLVDDVLDFVSSRQRVGKPVLNDLRCGVYTLPVALALRDDYGQELCAALQLAGDRRSNGAGGPDPTVSDTQLERAAAIIRSGDYFQRVLDLAMDHARAAADHLSSLDGPSARGLARLPSMYVERQLQAIAEEPVLGLPASISGP